VLTEVDRDHSEDHSLRTCRPLIEKRRDGSGKADREEPIG